MSLNTGNAILSNGITLDSSYNVGIGGAASGSYKLNVTGAGNFTGALTGASATFNGQLKITYSSASIDAMIFEDTRPTSGSGTWRMGAGTGGVGFGIYSNSLGTTPFFISASTGATTLSSSGTPALYSNANASYASGNNDVWNFLAPNQTGGALSFNIGKSLSSYNNAALKFNYLGNSSTSNFLGIGFYDNDNILNIKASGNVGINTTTPGDTLHIVKNGAGSYAAALWTNSNSTANLYVGVGGSGVANGPLQNNAYVMNAAASALILGTSDAERMRITSSGNVGIGTAAPAKPLEIYKAGSSTSQFKIGDSSTSKGYLGVFADSLYINAGGSYDGGWSTDGTNGIAGIVLETTNGGSAIAFGTASGNTSPSERMRITSGGQVLIGATSSSSQVEINGGSTSYGGGNGHLKITSSATGQSVLNISNTSVPKSFEIAVAGSSNPVAGSLYFYDNTAGAERGRITSGGYWILNGIVYGNTVGSPRTLYIDSVGGLGGISSVRASKTNINQIDSNWLMQLNPVSFNYRKKDEDGNYTNEHYDELFYGLIAEETELVNKEICNYNDGKLIGIEYSKLVPVLVKAIQEMNQTIQNQQQQINSLINR